MPAPIIAGAAAIAARLAAKKVSTNTAKKAAAKAAAKAKAKTEKIASNSVKVKTPDKSTPDSVRIARNNEATKMAARRKSGKLADLTASRVNTKAGNYLTSANPTGKAKVVKINSEVKAKTADQARAKATKTTKKKAK